MDNTKKPKFIICKGCGGMTHMLKGISCAISIALKTNRILIIDTHTHCAFLHRFNDFFNIKNDKLVYYDSYNVIPDDYLFKGLSKDEVEKSTFNYDKGLYYFKGHKVSVPDYSFNNDDIIMYCGNSSDVLNCIKVNPVAFNRVFKKKVVGTYMTVHYRNTDIKNNINKFIENINKVGREHRIKCVYVATDDAKAFSKIESSVDKNIRVMRKTIPDDNNGTNIHYGSKDKLKVIDNCLIDIYNILNSTVFIPSTNSGLSKWIINMIKSKEDIFDIKSKCIIYKS